MYVLMNNNKKLYFKGIDTCYNRPSFTYYYDNALRVKTEDEARMLADEYDLNIIKIKE